MATISNMTRYKEIAGFNAPAKPELVEVEWDFDKHGGAVGEYPCFKAKEACLVKFAGIKVDTLCTSGGSATMGAGKASDLAGVIAATAVASLTAGAFIPNAAIDASHKLAADDIMYMAIGTAAMTAGKCRLVFEVMKF